MGVGGLLGLRAHLLGGDRTIFGMFGLVARLFAPPEVSSRSSWTASRSAQRLVAGALGGMPRATPL
ncbi:MAG: hypothetical protein KY462_16410 [Actinobacteria bacterium]|nr:hypothetical protein [Actinomycetota bacterium]